VGVFELLMLAQGLVAGIKQGCELLNQGKAQIGEIKKAVNEVQAFAKEANSLWLTIKTVWASLFGGGKPAAPAAPAAPAVAAKPEAAKPAAKNVKREKEPELSYEEYQTLAVHQVCEQLKQFFEIRRKLTDHCRELEEISLTTTTVEDSAIDRVEIELQLEAMTVQVREAMVYAPKELRDIYSRFLAMYDQILEEQEFARQVKKKQERDEAARKWRQRDKRIDLLVEVIATVVLVVVVGAVLLDLKMQGTARSNFWHASSSTQQSCCLL